MADYSHSNLANPRPISTTGRLGLWRPDNALSAAISAQLWEVA
jgi:hypothetical protein